VDDEGKVTRSYGGQGGPGDLQLNFPCHLAVDEDSQLIFVADNHNGRVVLLSPTLEFVRYLRLGLRRPKRLYIHHNTRSLYAHVNLGLRRHNIVVMQL